MDAFLVDLLENGFLRPRRFGEIRGLRGVRRLRAARLGRGAKAGLGDRRRLCSGRRRSCRLLLRQLLDLRLQRRDLLVEVGGALREWIVLFLEQPHGKQVNAFGAGQGKSPAPPARWATSAPGPACTTPR